MAQFIDFIMRFSAEVTPEVGPPFKIYIIFPDQSIQQLNNTTLCPIDINRDYSQLQELLNEPLLISAQEGVAIDPIYPPPSGVNLAPDQPKDRELDLPYLGGTITPL